MTDGQHFLRWPTAAAALPFLSLIFGFLTERFQDTQVFSSSLVVLCLLVAVSVSSVQLGWFAYIGYVTSDIMSGRLGQSTFRSFRQNDQIPDSLEPLVSGGIEYILLFAGMIMIPSLILAIRVRMRVSGFSQTVGVVGERLAHLFVAVAAYAVWTQALISAIRGIFLSRGERLSSEAIEVVQNDWPIIVGAAAGAVVLRWVVEAQASRPEAISIVRETTNRYATRAAQAPVWFWPRIGGRVLLGTVLLCGLIAAWWHFGVTVAVLIAAALIREWLGATSLGRLLLRVPAVIRVAASAVIGWVVLSQVASSTFVNRTDEFIISLVGAWITVLIVAAINPKPSPPDDKNTAAPGPRPEPTAPAGNDADRPPLPTETPSSGRAGGGRVLGMVALGLLAIPTVFVSPAAADNCATPADCYGTAGTLLIALGLLLLVVAVLATGGLAAVPVGLAVPVVGGLTALELGAATLLLSGGTLIAADQIANNGGFDIGGSNAGPPRLPDPFPTGPLIGAAIAAIAGVVGADEILGPERGPPPAAQNPDHYIDSQGNLRWRDNNQLVEQFPTRSKFIDDDGVERWADTREPVNQAQNYRPQLIDQWGAPTVEFVESFGIDITLIQGDVGEILGDVARQAANGDQGHLGELEAIARWQSEGRTVEIPQRSTTEGVANPDYLVDGNLVEVKTRSSEIGGETLKRAIKKAASQIKLSAGSSTGSVEIQLTGDAASATLEEIDAQVRSQFTATRSRSLDRVAVYRDGELVSEWVRQSDGSTVQTFRRSEDG